MPKTVQRTVLHQIFQKIILGNETAIEELYKKYKELVINIAFSIVKNRDLSEEIAQMVFMKIIKMDKSKLPTSNESSWIYTVTKNETIEYLRKQHYTVVAAGYRCRFGEIDLIVHDRKYLVFVEVKLRKSQDFAKAMEAVDWRKQDKIRITASTYLSQNSTSLQPRFDVIEIYAPEGTATRKPQIFHMEDAFQ